jgi:hypothetical protein
MAYVAGDTITASQYNIFVNNSTSPYGYNHFAGTGSGEYGLGQTTLATVTGGANTITAAQFNSLFTAMNNIANHTNDTLTSTAAVATGDTIAIRAALEADLATLAASVAAGSPNATALTTSASLVTSDSSTRWNGNHTVEQSVTFASADDLRFFFNGGGKVRVTPSRQGNGSPAGATSKDSSFDELISAIGIFSIAAQSSSRSGTGETVTTNGLATGALELSTSYTTLLRLTQNSGSYTSNYVDVQAKLDDAVGTATVITVRFQFVDADGTDTLYGGGNNPPGYDAYVEFVGQTRVILTTMSPNTGEGLASVVTVSSTAQVSNTTV